MKKYLEFANKKGNGIEVEKLPIECPYCHKYQMPEMFYAYQNNPNFLFVFCACTNTNCRVAFNTIYDVRDNKFKNIKQSNLKIKEFNEEIIRLSPSFCEIYNQAYSAEQMQLEQITGVGYRKALEFLIKDYLISLHPENEEEIKKKPLGKCINDNVSDIKIKNVAKRATWIGNDETHYVRKWENKDISHLKSLIDLCVHWIEAEINTKRILEEMPE